VSPPEISIRRMTAADIPAGQRLREQAGWNQTADDWRRLLAWEPDGCFVGELVGEGGPPDRIVASATTTVYGPELAWIGMVLVDPAYRRRGFGRALFNRATACLDGRGVRTIGLDATPVGKAMYDRLGYRDEYLLERRLGTPPALPPGGARPLTAADLPTVAAFDAGAFGVDRARILEALHAGDPGGGWVVEGTGALRGYLLTRPGTRARHFGPLVALDEDAADELVRTALHDPRSGSALGSQPVVMDVVLANPAAVALSERLGLEPRRQFIRMTRGAPAPPAELAALYTSAAPEIG
jgi:GNAT superfamily N-acetyltransferase